jgi:hypothetical protein
MSWVPPHLRKTGQVTAQDTPEGEGERVGSPEADDARKPAAEATRESPTGRIRTEQSPSTDDIGSASQQTNPERIVTDDTTSFYSNPQTEPRGHETEKSADGCPATDTQAVPVHHISDLNYAAALLGRCDDVHGTESAAELVTPLLLNTVEAGHVEFIPSSSPSTTDESEIGGKCSLHDAETTEAPKFAAQADYPVKANGASSRNGSPPPAPRYIP